MNSQISLAMILTLCLSNAAQRGFGKENVTLGMLISRDLQFEYEYEIRYEYDFSILVYSVQIITY